ncbi:helix-turn-helix domain-containing protein [Fodinibacter luteus]|uniref:Helix-turn-helix domain-containing protein n=1 Tax=Fodinibacter luteus TaxID=552064 RepID=A0ABP8K3A3_9MICO
MPDRTKATPPPTATVAGVLRPGELSRHVDLARDPAGPVAGRWVENRWSLRWHLPPGRWYDSEILPHPTCSLTVELGSHPRAGIPAGETVVVTGVCTRRFDVEVRGWGRVLGLRFRPGGLAALTGHPASAWTNRSVAASDVLPAHLTEALSDPDLVGLDAAAWADVAEAGLAVLADNRPDPRYDLLLEVVADMLADRTMLTVADVADRHAVTVRTLQRLFTHYVGVGPKWVLGRYRMHDAVSDLDAGFHGTLTDLAVRYGWYDQAHFTRDFTELIGVTPGRYRDRTTAADAGRAASAAG